MRENFVDVNINVKNKIYSAIFCEILKLLFSSVFVNIKTPSMFFLLNANVSSIDVFIKSNSTFWQPLTTFQYSSLNVWISGTGIKIPIVLPGRVTLIIFFVPVFAVLVNKSLYNLSGFLINLLFLVNVIILFIIIGSTCYSCRKQMTKCLLCKQKHDEYEQLQEH